MPASLLFCSIWENSYLPHLQRLDLPSDHLVLVHEASSHWRRKINFKKSELGNHNVCLHSSHTSQSFSQMWCFRLISPSILEVQSPNSPFFLSLLTTFAIQRCISSFNKRKWHERFFVLKKNKICLLSIQMLFPSGQARSSQEEQ